MFVPLQHWLRALHYWLRALHYWLRALALVHSTAEYCAPVWCRSAHNRHIDPPSMTPCELWRDACVLHQRTTFQSSQASNLLSSVAEEPHFSRTPCPRAWTPAPLSAPQLESGRVFGSGSGRIGFELTISIYFRLSSGSFFVHQEMFYESVCKK